MSPKRLRDDDDDDDLSEARKKRKREKNAPVLSGTLGGELKKHAFERCRHFFLYLTTIKSLEFLSNPANPKARIRALDGLAVKATDQIDDGFRVEDDEYSEFKNDDEGVILLSTTAFKKIDAAHFCNLGIKPNFAGTLDLTKKVIFDMYEFLKTVAGNTRWLPQRVNIGPDRRIDILHGKLAEEMLGDGAVIFSRARIKVYIERATASLKEYAADCVKKKKRGVAKCAGCYLESYAEDDFLDRIFATLHGGIAGWAKATDNEQAFEYLITFT